MTPSDLPRGIPLSPPRSPRLRLFPCSFSSPSPRPLSPPMDRPDPTEHHHCPHLHPRPRPHPFPRPHPLGSSWSPWSSPIESTTRGRPSRTATISDAASWACAGSMTPYSPRTSFASASDPRPLWTVASVAHLAATARSADSIPSASPRPQSLGRSPLDPPCPLRCRVTASSRSGDVLPLAAAAAAAAMMMMMPTPSTAEADSPRILSSAPAPEASMGSARPRLAVVRVAAPHPVPGQTESASRPDDRPTHREVQTPLALSRRGHGRGADDGVLVVGDVVEQSRDGGTGEDPTEPCTIAPDAPEQILESSPGVPSQDMFVGRVDCWASPRKPISLGVPLILSPLPVTFEGTAHSPPSQPRALEAPRPTDRHTHTPHIHHEARRPPPLHSPFHRR